MKKPIIDIPLSLKDLKRDPFVAPTGYFEQLPHQLLQRIEQPRTTPKQKTFFAHKTTWLAAAACATLLLSFFALQPLMERKDAARHDEILQEYLLSRIESQIWIDAAADYYIENAKIITDEDPQAALEEEIMDYIMDTSF